GSTDESHQIAAAYGVRLIRTENRGLSAARNTGADAADGEIVAYLDDDAWPDPDWLHYLAKAFMTTDHVGIGGPNIAPDEDDAVASCVANAPGGPIHVLLSDTVAEHIPGCNMAYRRDGLLAVGGFDPQFRVAGDDVDVCWKLQKAGGTLGYHAGAMVWHHRRATLRRFWRQQRGYGRAEALLERKWPEKYNRPGHLTWAGRVYGRGAWGGPHRWRVYYGVWGTGAFQPGFERPPASLPAVAASPEWYLVIAALSSAFGLGLFWPPLLAVGPLLVLALLALVWRAAAGAAHAELDPGVRARRRLTLRGLIGLLHVLQPAARLTGRIGGGLAPWRRPGLSGFVLPGRRVTSAWHECWCAPEERLQGLEQSLRAAGARVRSGGPFDHWDLEVAAGSIGSVRVRSTVEEHGFGRQMTRCLTCPRVSRFAAVTGVGLASLAVAAAADGALIVSAILLALALVLAVAGVRESGEATAAVAGAMNPGSAAARLRPADVPQKQSGGAVIALPIDVTRRMTAGGLSVQETRVKAGAASSAGAQEQ
ncbi:MAG: glycosyltransferase, partial [Actinomycetota bacterium]|nr:glycosyltransferase [Actinomycetota bacterium]